MVAQTVMPWLVSDLTTDITSLAVYESRPEVCGGRGAKRQLEEASE
jgi:hypothetical protein